jgi:hypothetical protein
MAGSDFSEVIGFSLVKDLDPVHSGAPEYVRDGLCIILSGIANKIPPGKEGYAG